MQTKVLLLYVDFSEVGNKAQRDEVICFPPSLGDKAGTGTQVSRFWSLCYIYCNSAPTAPRAFQMRVQKQE